MTAQTADYLRNVLFAENQPDASITPTRVADLVDSVPVFDDPTSSLGAPAILRGTISTYNIGLAFGSGQTTDVQQANADILQNAINAAVSTNRFLEVVPGIVEIFTPAGLFVPGGTSGFVWRGSPTLSIIVQVCNFAPGCPILTIGNATMSTGMNFSGVSLQYGNDQTVRTASIPLTLGAMSSGVIENVNLSNWTFPGYDGILINQVNSSMNYRNINVSGAQRHMLNISGSGSTGNHFDNVVLQNTNQTDSPAMLGSFVFFGGDATNMLFSRLSCRWGSCNRVISCLTGNQAGLTFDAMSVEGVLMSGADPVIFDLSDNTSAVVNSLDLANPFIRSVSLTGTPYLVRDLASGAGSMLINNFHIRTMSAKPVFDPTGPNSIDTALTLYAGGNVFGDDQPLFAIDSAKFQDDTMQLAGHISFDANLNVSFGSPSGFSRYRYSPAASVIEGAVIPISAPFTLYGQFYDTTILVPASITSFAIILAASMGPAGSSPQPVTLGNTVRVRRQSGLASGTLTVLDDVGTVIGTITQAGTDSFFLFNGTHFVPFNAVPTVASTVVGAPATFQPNAPIGTMVGPIHVTMSDGSSFIGTTALTGTANDNQDFTIQNNNLVVAVNNLGAGNYTIQITATPTVGKSAQFTQVISVVSQTAVRASRIADLLESIGVGTWPNGQDLTPPTGYNTGHTTPASHVTAFQYLTANSGMGIIGRMFEDGTTNVTNEVNFANAVTATMPNVKWAVAPGFGYSLAATQGVGDGIANLAFVEGITEPNNGDPGVHTSITALTGTQSSGQISPVLAGPAQAQLPVSTSLPITGCTIADNFNTPLQPGNVTLNVTCTGANTLTVTAPASALIISSTPVTTPTGNFVNVNFTSQIANRSVAGSLYGVAMSTSFSNWGASFGNPTWVAQMAAFDMKLVRIQFEDTMGKIFPTLTSAPDFSSLAPLVANINTAFPHADIMWTIGWANVYFSGWSTSQKNTFANQCVQLATYLKSHGVNVKYWELFNEPDNQGFVPSGSVPNLFDRATVQAVESVVYPAMAAVDSNYKFGQSPPSFFQNYSVSVSVAAYPPLTYAAGHWYSGGSDLGTAGFISQGNSVAGNVSRTSLTVNGKVYPFALNEYALDFNGVSAGLNTIVGAITYALILTHGALDGTFFAAGAWDAVQNVFGFAPNAWAPHVYFFSKAGQTMPGNVVVSNTSGANILTIATTGAVMVINYDQTVAFNNRTVAMGGLLNTSLHAWQLSSLNPTGIVSTVPLTSATVTSQNFPPLSITIYYP